MICVLPRRVEVAAVSEHAAIPPQPTGVRFTVPSEAEPAGPGGFPHPARRPDPSWKPAPGGWQWWVPVWD
ncbi:hypothetical protein [Micromonospora cremea]|uniref:hypothetical protein n=1 Tax=Micromonospora cremea TaxID=709881 RepID=UPI00117F620E|nr:hypothetical protein [Micromonospora cremea]